MILHRFDNNFLTLGLIVYRVPKPFTWKKCNLRHIKNIKPYWMQGIMKCTER
jgi:hypothetical protein